MAMSFGRLSTMPESAFAAELSPDRDEKRSDDQQHAAERTTAQRGNRRMENLSTHGGSHMQGPTDVSTAFHEHCAQGRPPNPRDRADGTLAHPSHLPLRLATRAAAGLGSRDTLTRAAKSPQASAPPGDHDVVR